MNTLIRTSSTSLTFAAMLFLLNPWTAQAALIFMHEVHAEVAFDDLQINGNAVAMNLAPTRISTTASDVGEAENGETSYSFDIVYGDDSGVDFSTIDANDVNVVGPGGPIPVNMGGSIIPTGSPLTATYTFTPPGGSWNAADNGLYSIVIVANEVGDNDGTQLYVAAGAAGSFNVNASPESPVIAGITAEDVPFSQFGDTSYSFTVRYTDNNAVVASSIDGNDFTVTTPGGVPAVTSLAGMTTDPNGSLLTATYNFVPPGGSWGAEDDGTYTINIAASEVLDLVGLPVPVTSGAATFVVDSDRLMCETFETDGSGGARYTITGPEFHNTATVTTHFARINDVNGNAAGGETPLINLDNTSQDEYIDFADEWYFAAEAVHDPFGATKPVFRVIDLNPLATAGHTGLAFSGLFGAGDNTVELAYNSASFLAVLYSTDGGSTYTPGLVFRANVNAGSSSGFPFNRVDDIQPSGINGVVTLQDLAAQIATGDIVTDGTSANIFSYMLGDGGGTNAATGLTLTEALQSCAFSIPGTPASVRLRLVLNSNLIHQEMAFDELKLSGTFAPAEININDGPNVSGADIADGGAAANFGSVIAAGAASVVRTFNVDNAGGTAALNVSSITKTGSHPGDFTVGALTPASPIGVGNSATFTVTFDPLAVGPRTATLIVNNNDPDEASYEIVLNGNGTVADGPPQPVLYYDFEEQTGTNVTNLGSAGGQGIFTNNPVWVTGTPGNTDGGVEFNGQPFATASYIDTGLSAATLGVHNTNGTFAPFTMTAWVQGGKTEIPGTTYNDEFVFGQIAANNVLHLGIRDQRPHFGNWGDDATATGFFMETGTWYHVAWQLDESNVQRIFINGEMRVRRQSGGIGIKRDLNIVIGTSTTADRTLLGQVDDTAIYADVLSLSQIQFLAGGGSPTNLPEALAVDDVLWTAPTGTNGTWNLYQVLGGDTGPLVTWYEAYLSSTNLDPIVGTTTGHLATVQSIQENEWCRYLRNNYGIDAFIGLTDNDTNTVNLVFPGAFESGNTTEVPDLNTRRNNGWVWANGEAYGPTTFKRFGGAEPNDSPAEDAVEITGNGNWNDVPSSIPGSGEIDFRQLAIVEWSLNSPTPIPGARVRDAILPSTDQLPGDTGSPGSFSGWWVEDNGTLGTIRAASASIMSGNGTIISTNENIPVINAYDPQTGGLDLGLFPNNDPYFAEDASTNDTQFAVLYRGVINVPAGEAGEYTFGVHSDDGFALRLPGYEWETVYGIGWVDHGDKETITYEYGIADSNTRGVISLPEGQHVIEFLVFNGTSTQAPRTLRRQRPLCERRRYRRLAPDRPPVHRRLDIRRNRKQLDGLALRKRTGWQHKQRLECRDQLYCSRQQYVHLGRD